LKLSLMTRRFVCFGQTHLRRSVRAGFRFFFAQNLGGTRPRRVKEIGFFFGSYLGGTHSRTGKILLIFWLISKRHSSQNRENTFIFSIISRRYTSQFDEKYLYFSQ